ncbi:MAG: Fe-S cluster assembly protein SufD [Xanthomonadaceae bacterium]|uniref:Fe-S cluster assembly protein SufD n=1 Tax=Luteimonas wenzhouensis TaxID=2599615 RepID=A0A5C5TWD7_9GAMM|nr:Fe-S cluster assembly protein SufD [Xanthomonadaceae bacterium]TWT17748.1 Fe-S cluster assembly protein SufD [Luteimonas wenzhouensis]
MASGFSGDDARRALLEAALRDGLPGPRSERWKYTPLRALDRRSFGTPGPATIDAALLDGIPAPRLVFVNGGFDAALSRLDALPAGVELAADGPGEASVPEATGDGPVRPGDTVFARLNVALARTGVHLRVAESVQVAQPVHLVFVGAEAGADAVAWHLRHRIEVAASASLRVIEHHLAHGVHRHLDTATLAVSVAQDALLEHARVQGPADGATSFARTDAVLQARAGYHRVDLELGGALSRHELNVRLEGEGASLAAHGVLLANGRRHVDTRLGIEHAARDTRCELLWRGIGAGRGHVVFHGGITIHPGADGTDARLSNKNLLLSPNAEIDTQPVLVIHADEVQAAHGATVGQLDANALFYLRARGVPQAEARQMLTAAFCREPLAAVEDAAVGEALLARLDAALEGLSA